MKPNVYKIYDVNIPETFKRIDSFLGEDTMDLIENQPILNENNIKTIKMLISDLTVLDGLKPKELKKREQQVFKLISMLSLYYLSQTAEIDVMNNLFLIPEKS
jgi:hypothetical protein